MAENDDSAGLKIAVAAFIMLTVILAATSYFLFARGEAAQARLAAERDIQQLQRRTAQMAVMYYDEMRTKIGTHASDIDPAKAEISANFRQVDERLEKIMSTVNAAIQTAQQNGAARPELENAKANVQKVIASFHNEPNKTYIAALERLTELAESLAVLTSQLARNDDGVKKNPEATPSTAKSQKDQTSAAKD